MTASGGPVIPFQGITQGCSFSITGAGSFNNTRTASAPAHAPAAEAIPVEPSGTEDMTAVMRGATAQVIPAPRSSTPGKIART